MTSEPAVDDELVDVHLVRYPLRLGRRATEHYEEVFRELALLADTQPPVPDSMPSRLLALVGDLGRRYPRQQVHEGERDAALRAGETSRDMVIQVGASMVEGTKILDSLLDETDDLCRSGGLLTLGPPEGVLDFRRWYLAQCMTQLQGGVAVPWPGDLD